MSKVSITGPKNQLENVIETLHSLELLHLEDYEGELEKGDTLEEGEKLSELLIDVRSLLSKLEGPEEYQKETASIKEIQEKLPQIKAEIETIERDKEKTRSKHSSLKEQKKFFRKLKGIEIPYQDLKEESENIDIWIGQLKTSKFDQQIETDRYEIKDGRQLKVLIYDKEKENEIKTALSNVKAKETQPLRVNRKGTPKKILNEIEKEKRELEKKLEELENKSSEIAEKFYGKLQHTEQYLTEEIEKAEAPLSFATTERAFISEGWIPSNKFDILEEKLQEETQGKIHIEEIEGENPPVKQKNNKLVKPFESLTNLMSVPRQNELDPSFMLLLTFPLMFGLMIGDVGYGLSSALVFYGGMKMLPDSSQIFKALMWTSAATVLFGLIYGEMFGFQIYESPFYRADYWTEILALSAVIGVAHVNTGLLLGAYNEFTRHGVVAAILEKGSWIALQISVVIWYLTSWQVGATLVLLSLIMLYKGEGIEGVVEIPSLVSNVLSYLRLFGVCMAAYMLAGTVNSLASPAFASGTLIGAALGTLIIIIGHTILTFVKIMEGFLQGIRLHYVEHFNWYYEGGGRKYMPFGSD